MQFKTKTPPSEEPVTLAEVKAALRIDHSDEDDVIEREIKTAREWVEEYLERPIVTQTITGATDRFSRRMELKPNLQSIAEIRYTDADGVEQTLDSAVYALDDYALVGAVYLAPDQEWPSTRGEPFDVQVDFVAGYGAAVDVPSRVKSAVIAAVGDRLENRENSAPSDRYEVPMSSKALVAKDRMANF